MGLRSIDVHVILKPLQENSSKVNKQLEHMDWKADMMYKKMEDMDSSNKMMTKTVTKTQTAIDALQ